jgi:hypothetical protein
METSGRVIASVSTLIALVCTFALAPTALAQDAATAGKETFDAMIEARSEGNDAGAASQERVDAVSDQTDDLLSQFRTVMKQIDSIDLYNGQMHELIASQNAEMASLDDQLGRIQEVGRSVTPLMLKMVDAIEKFVALDVPFLIKERTKRIDGLTGMMSRADVTRAEKFRQIMEAYQIENEYGRTIEAYRSTLTIGDKETTVDFLRFGRISLVYQSLDETQTGAWDQKAKKWVELDSSYRTPIRDGLRIARKQSAPDLIRLPLPAPTNAGGAG